MSDMSDGPIPPALTPDEWRAPAEEHGQRLFWFDDNNVVVGLRSAAISVNWDGAVYDSGPQQLSAKSRHAVAALCLYGQPFGFTPEDVTWLRGAASYLGGDSTRGAEWAARLVSLADRIEALLPPEKA